MKPTKPLHDLGQSLWLDNIARSLVNSGTLQRYIDEFSVTGLTSNPTIFDHAIKNSADYDSDISQSASATKPPEDLFFDLALADLTRAADLFEPIFAARDLHQRGDKPNLFHQDSRHRGRIARNRGGNLRWRSSQRHAFIFPRAICCGG
jgi:Transaldolase/Fructose-6-phosphate aldolase